MTAAQSACTRGLAWCTNCDLDRDGTTCHLGEIEGSGAFVLLSVLEDTDGRLSPVTYNPGIHGQEFGPAVDVVAMAALLLSAVSEGERTPVGAL